VEVLIVIGIIAFLIALLIPGLNAARESAQKAICLSNLRQVGLAIQTYSNSNRGNIPYGPKAPPVFSATDFYPATGTPTSLISLKSGAPVGLGLLLQSYLSQQQRVLFCPTPDQPLSADAELAKVGAGQAQGSYYYRHGSMTNLYDPPGVPMPVSDYVKLSNLGINRQGSKIRALVMDSMFLAHPSLSMFGITPRTHHRQKFANVLYSDGHTESRHNQGQRYTVNLQDHATAIKAFNLILNAFEQADREH
jgi:prepilin-type processing-associated H-X9-DG protein